MKTQVMLDLETLGQRPGAVIVAIGAVKFRPLDSEMRRWEVGDSFYERIDAQSCVDAGLKVEMATVQWWLRQGDVARKELDLPGMAIRKGLAAFREWIGQEEVEMWGNGAAFDNALLAEAYKVCGLPAPWKWWNDRCYRTMKCLWRHVPVRENEGTKHNALDDAITQALHLIEILREMWRVESGDGPAGMFALQGEPARMPALPVEQALQGEQELKLNPQSI